MFHRWTGRVVSWLAVVGALSACGKVENSSGGASGSGFIASGGTGGTGGLSSIGGLGAAGAGGADTTPQVTSSNKLDLLLMIDNSASMQDKQSVLAAAVPKLVSRLVAPICVDANGAPVGGSVDAGGQCATGAPEFPPVKDIHIAIVTSSLGSHGGDVCNTATNADDHGQALGSVRPGLEQWNDSGFLAWDPLSIANPPAPKNTPPGNETDANKLSADLATQVVAAGEVGCGYEASLEAWYRFLVDPEPPNTVDVMNDVSTKEGINQTLLMERSQFLRPDSVLAIVALSDENDCSIEDAGFGWFLASRTLNGAETRMFRSTHFCDADANDPCCMSCGDTSVPPPQCGIATTTQDPSCQLDGGYLTAATDNVALRCWDTKRRFGFDLMYPTQRYSRSLQQTTICRDSSGRLDNDVGASGCTPTVNPLYDPNISVLSGGKASAARRSASLVFFSAIVGVPWQDLATDATRDMPNQLAYLTEQELEMAGRWQVILGDPTALPPVLPSDPFMVETDLDRTTLPIAQANPIEPTAMLVPHTSQNPQANVINGHEQNIVNADDLQYACTFPLTPPRVCMPNMQACDCSPTSSGDLTPVTTYNSSLCNPPGGGAPSATQHYAKGYPGLRFLKVLHDFGENAIPASICPKVTDQTRADDGYNPAVAAIIDRLKVPLRNP
ncbi:MAG TPA: hypothetical protein VGI10_17965 [Polyangiaceae bacterium]|jgi:hypothetical protein